MFRAAASSQSEDRDLDLPHLGDLGLERISARALLGLLQSLALVLQQTIDWSVRERIAALLHAGGWAAASKPDEDATGLLSCVHAVSQVHHYRVRSSQPDSVKPMSPFLHLPSYESIYSQYLAASVPALAEDALRYAQSGLAGENRKYSVFTFGADRKSVLIFREGHGQEILGSLSADFIKPFRAVLDDGFYFGRLKLSGAMADDWSIKVQSVLCNVPNIGFTMPFRSYLGSNTEGAYRSHEDRAFGAYFTRETVAAELTKLGLPFGTCVFFARNAYE